MSPDVEEEVEGKTKERVPSNYFVVPKLYLKGQRRSTPKMNKTIRKNPFNIN